MVGVLRPVVVNELIVWVKWTAASKEFDHSLVRGWGRGGREWWTGVGGNNLP